jgi:hypothetical protein
MKPQDLQRQTVPELVNLFANIALAQDEAQFSDDYARYNRLFDRMESVEAELKSRPMDQRLALVGLFDHQNLQFRLAAAKATLAVAPQEARQMLHAIEALGRQPQAGDAGMCLWNLDRGVFVPK